MFYAWYHKCEQVSSQLCLLCIIWISLPLFYKGRLFTNWYLRTVVSSNNLYATWNLSVQEYPWLLRPWSIFLVTKETEIPIGTTIDVSTPPPWFMLQLGFIFFNVEIIHGFTLTFVDICYDTSYPLGFTYIIKLTTLDILKFLVTTLRNQDKKVAY